MSSKKRSLTYRDAGVQIKRADRLVQFLLAKTRRQTSFENLGGFAALQDISKTLGAYEQPVLAMATDGVGTKLALARNARDHQCLGIDLVAMCVNDLICSGARPLFFLDYYATGVLRLAQAKPFIAGVLQGCAEAGCRLVGGETAEMPGFYPQGRYDVAGFCVGIVERKKRIGHAASKGSMLIGLPSSGMHANGFSLVRRLLAEGRLKATARITASKTRSISLRNALMTPTRIYVRPILELAKRYTIQGLAHITGGGITDNLLRALPPGYGAVIKSHALATFSRSFLFNTIQDAAALSDAQMRRTFNCGVGMILILPAKQADAALATLHNRGEDARIIGEVDRSSKIRYV